MIKRATSFRVQTTAFMPLDNKREEREKSIDEKDASSCQNTIPICSAIFRQTGIFSSISALFSESSQLSPYLFGNSASQGSEAFRAVAIVFFNFPSQSLLPDLDL